MPSPTVLRIAAVIVLALSATTNTAQALGADTSHRIHPSRQREPVPPMDDRRAGAGELALVPAGGSSEVGPVGPRGAGTTSSVRGMSQLPRGLQAVVRRSMTREALTDYFVARTAIGYRVANPSQRLQIVFGPAGPTVSPVDSPASASLSRDRQPRGGVERAFSLQRSTLKESWIWGIRLVSYGRDHPRAAPSARPVGRNGRVEYRRGGLIEWYRNTTRGLEQGFTLQRPPEGSRAGPVRLEMALSGNLDARLEAHGRGLELLEPGGAVLRYDGLQAVDARGRKLGVHMSLHGRGLELMVADSGARYPVRIDPWVHSAQLNMGSNQVNSDLGSSVALSANGGEALLGAQCRTVNGLTCAGAGEVFTRSGTAWSFTAQLDLGSSAAGGDVLGSSAALSGDGSEALLGAKGRTVNGQGDAGAGEVFTLSGGIWSFTAQLDMSSGAGGAFPAGFDQLGASAALSSDGSEALLGAPNALVSEPGTSGIQAGAGEVFTRSGSTWSYIAQLDLRSNAVAGNSLGQSAALSSGGSEALLGAPGRTVNGQGGGGAVEVFGLSAGAWSFTTQLDLGTKAASGDQLGRSAALSGDGAEALLGAPVRTVNGRAGAGAGEVFTLSGGVWSFTAQLDLGSSAAGGDNLGWSAALSRDGSQALLGALGRSVNGQGNAGAGEVFSQSGGAWSFTTQLDLGTSAAGNDGLGLSAALSSNGTEALLGAQNRTVDGLPDAGAGEVFDQSGGTWSFTTQLDLGTGGGSDMLGASVALSSDGTEAVLGAPHRTVDGQPDAGAAEVFTLSAGAWSFAAQLDLGTNAGRFDGLGSTVALSSDGSEALLGAPNRAVNFKSIAGAGEVFTRGGSTWSFTAQLDLGTGAGADDALGGSVAVSGDGSEVLLGADGRSVNGQAAAGAGEVFTRGSGGVWSAATQLDLGTNAAAGDTLSYSASLSADGTEALLGAIHRTVNGQDAGAGEVFTLSGGVWSFAAQLNLGASAALSDELGTSAVLSGNGAEALLGAYNRTVDGQAHAGAGEVFALSGGVWSFAAQLDLGTNAAANDNLGTSAALSSNGAEALLGARGRTVNGQLDAGAAEVFTRSGGVWSFVTQLDMGANAAANDELGESVALSSDGSGALLGAPTRIANGQVEAGVGEVFSGPAAPTVARVARFTAQRHHGTVVFRWRMTVQTGTAGFRLYAAPRRGHQRLLNAKLIPVHRGLTYRYNTRYTGRATFRLHILLTDGTQVVVPAGQEG